MLSSLAIQNVFRFKVSLHKIDTSCSIGVFLITAIRSSFRRKFGFELIGELSNFSVSIYVFRVSLMEAEFFIHPLFSLSTVMGGLTDRHIMSKKVSKLSFEFDGVVKLTGSSGALEVEP